MTFASKSLEPASERFFLFKLTVRRYLFISFLKPSPNVYNFDIPNDLIIEAVHINDVLISPSNYTYSNGLLQITSLLDLQTSENVVTLDHNIFLTGGKTRYTSGVAGIPDATWQPLIETYPSFSQSMRNIAEGVFSLSATEIRLICTDRWAQNLIGKPDQVTYFEQYNSLSMSPVTVWSCIDSASDNRKIFDGEVASVNYKYGQLTLSVIDTFQKLTALGSFGDRSQSQIYTGNNSGTQKPKPEDENSISPVTMGKSSPFTISPGYKHIDPFDTPPCPLYHLSDGMRPKLVSPANPNQSSTTVWHAGRVVGSGVKLINFGPIVGNTLLYKLKKDVENTTVVEVPLGTDYAEIQPYTLINYVFFVQLQNISNFTGQIGDYIPKTYMPSGYTDNDGYIAGFGNGLYGSYNLAIATTSTVIRAGSSSIHLNETLPAMSLPNNLLPSMSVWIEAGDSADYSFDARDLSIGVTQIKRKDNFFTRYLPFTQGYGRTFTIGGKTVKEVYIQLSPNSQVNISSSIIKCRFSPADSMSHGETLKFIVKSSGMTTNDASFAQADIDFPANVSVTFPRDNSEQFSSYLECAQSVTSSTLGLLRVNQNREVEYELIKNPSALTTDGIRDKINMLDGRTSTNVEYQDLVSTVQFENPQLNDLTALTFTGPKYVLNFPIIKQLHRVNKTITIKHVLESIYNRAAAIAGYLCAPTVEYTLATASEDLASSIGDVIEINNTAVADSVQTTKGVIVGLEQSGSETTVKINEIRGVP